MEKIVVLFFPLNIYDIFLSVEIRENFEKDLISHLKVQLRLLEF